MKGETAGYIEFSGSFVDNDKLVHLSFKFDKNHKPEFNVTDEYYNRELKSVDSVRTWYTFARIRKAADQYVITGFKGNDIELLLRFFKINIGYYYNYNLFFL